MTTIWADELSPNVLSNSVFLLGPTPRDKDTPSWRPEATRLFKDKGFDGTLLIPERHNWTEGFDYVSQVDWEHHGIEICTVAMFWIPREMKTMPSLTSNIEFGLLLGGYFGHKRVVYGRPPEAEKCRYLDHLWRKTGREPKTTLAATVEEAMEIVARSK